MVRLDGRVSTLCAEPGMCDAVAATSTSTIWFVGMQVWTQTPPARTSAATLTRRNQGSIRYLTWISSSAWPRCLCRCHLPVGRLRCAHRVRATRARGGAGGGAARPARGGGHQQGRPAARVEAGAGGREWGRCEWCNGHERYGTLSRPAVIYTRTMRVPVMMHANVEST